MLDEENLSIREQFFLLAATFSIASSVNLSILHSPSGILSSLHVHRERKKAIS